MQVLFLNMESDIGSLAAFVFAHTEAIKGMRQMITIIEDAYEGAPPDDDAVQQEIQEQKDLVQQARCPCLCPVYPKPIPVYWSDM